MDKNTWIGFLLIAAIIVGFTLLNRPSKEELAERQRVQDSISVARQAMVEAQRISDSISLSLEAADATAPEKVEESKPEEQWITLQNEHLKLTLSSYGGVIQRAELLDYHASGDTVNPLCLFRADESSFGFTLITINNRILHTSNLIFTPVETGDPRKAIMRLPGTTEDAWLDFVYELSDNYMVHLALVPHNMQNELAQNVNSLELHWRQLIPQHEQGRKFEERYAQLQYMVTGGEMEKLSENKDDSEKESARVKWIGYKDQFFSSVLIADDAFSSSYFTSTVQGKNSGYIKEYTTQTSVPFDLNGRTETGFRFYLGPNHYHTLKAYDDGVARDERLRLNKLVPLGWKIVSWINTALVIPMFDLFTGWGLHIGIVILLMTIVIKLIILPFVFVSYKSSAKMRALRPQIEEINAKFPAEKMQERQQATMQLYQQAGVNPMSGCLPMLFQFPVLMAMFWFLPTAIELRGKSLWWADDLSTYDAVFHWGFNIPLLGDHLSLFCLLMTIANFGYTFITMQSQATDPNMKFMKYMMYAMPLMFLFIFNDYAAGLSYYYLLSLFITILQTMIFRWALDDEKMLREMEENKKKKAGKKKSGFMERLEAMQREQQKLARERAKAAQRR
ncbi:MAG: membrane protein insertase YidC [Paludibacteraceae bacterium]|nr:membrane protein insertase YidC [Paludibacteraceae bacterium]